MAGGARCRGAPRAPARALGPALPVRPGSPVRAPGASSQSGSGAWPRLRDARRCQRIPRVVGLGRWLRPMSSSPS